MDLYGYFRSSASYRVRIGLNLKGLDYEYYPVNLLKGDQHGEHYHRLNPQRLLPTLDDGNSRLTQSLAILEWLDETHPEPALLPKDPIARAQIRALAHSVASDIQPLQNLRVLKYLQAQLEISDEDKIQWIQHWIQLGFSALEKQLIPAPFAAGDTPGLFECCLLPQIYSAERFGMDMDQYPKIQKIAYACNELPAFIKAHPSEQPDCIV
ncbi:maleylacetoacetate isomerase [Microbulbifer sp. OS29]|uniref:Maleylacetoacetate isomerase n=1 Tax=Microbulbifer okhotskensis TaxID=2926617 RepID=A0A9X2EV78_9GAMM|nr:maleylacetoacetate isomerase [Microbulbifer okhotskensis]MCO1336548.1 maleylacetoacetate isomerase [Microbulbifer okhotskensis]